ncbi:ribosome maturation factor RimP [Rhodocytophaga rosea]|uniref:Ribosome maturation factor RimP n=1 Tax=Rhodocytophaga rosea TaxID=2704465 RepID=A0A6C0GNP8_9BACT|nr:ribosome maturation factor RimP [Rhodocytophaga rosea]QHT69474.1 ribosome maturation factor RimP [Rhodocytophaga rosea]
MELKEQIEDLVAVQLKGSPYFLVNVVIAGVKSVPKITVWIDGDEGVSIDKCAEISRKLGNQLEERELIPTAYTLEVSSPGIDQPLKWFRQYKQHTGRKLKVTLKDGTIKTGTLTHVQEDSILLTEEKKAKKKSETEPPAEIKLADIDKTFVLVSFI